MVLSASVDPQSIVSGGRVTEAIERFCPLCARRYPPDVSACEADGQALAEVGLGDDLSGSSLRDKYLLVERLGMGTFGAVYMAVHRLARTEVAIKLLHVEHQQNAEVRRRFLKEAQVVMRLASPHTVKVNDIDEDKQGHLFIVMELLHGRELADLLKSARAEGRLLPHEQVVELVKPICLALEEAHELGIVHRDLKPANVMLERTRDGSENVKVVDFGIARITQSSDTGLTMTETMTSGRISGTPTYMSPEQCLGKHLDARSDLYGLGVMMYEMVTGMRPFSSETSQGMLVAHVTEAPPSIRAAFPELKVPGRLAELIMGLMEKRQDDRPESARVVLEMLEDCLDPGAQDTVYGVNRPSIPGPSMRIKDEVSDTVSSAPISEPAKMGDSVRGGSATWIAAAVLLVVVLAIGWVLLGTGINATEPKPAQGPAAAPVAPEREQARPVAAPRVMSQTPVSTKPAPVKPAARAVARPVHTAPAAKPASKTPGPKRQPVPAPPSGLAKPAAATQTPNPTAARPSAKNAPAKPTAEPQSKQVKSPPAAKPAPTPPPVAATVPQRAQPTKAAPKQKAAARTKAPRAPRPALETMDLDEEKTVPAGTFKKKGGARKNADDSFDELDNMDW